MKRKKKKQPIPCFLFTPETIQVIQKALKLFEQALQRADHQRPKVAFAEETTNQVKGKLDAMTTSVGQMGLTPFDSNEKIVIATAIQLYTVDLLSAPSHARRERELQACQQVARFALDKFTFEPWKATQD